MSHKRPGERSRKSSKSIEGATNRQNLEKTFSTKSVRKSSEQDSNSRKSLKQSENQPPIAQISASLRQSPQNDFSPFHPHSEQPSISKSNHIPDTSRLQNPVDKNSSQASMKKPRHAINFESVDHEQSVQELQYAVEN